MCQCSFLLSCYSAFVNMNIVKNTKASMVNVHFSRSMTTTDHMLQCWKKLRICILVNGKGSTGRLNQSKEEVCEFYKLYVWKTEETHQYSERTCVQQQCCLIFIIFPIRVSPAHFENLRKAPTGSYSRLSMLKVNRSMSTLKHTHFQAISVTPAHSGNLLRASTGFYGRLSMLK